jgi:acetolactate synthase-1/2/3 large subunit
MKASDFIARFLEKQNVTHVFELSGGMITHILDSLQERGTIQIVSMHHEQGAAFAADGWARVKGVPGVALATSGPGATNLITGIGSCFFDSVPAVFITGQVNQHEQKGNRPVRQLGFQETDIISVATPLTKVAIQLQSADDLPAVLAEAFSLALSGRPGPVLIDIPMNLQRAEVAEQEIPFIQPERKGTGVLTESFWKELQEVLQAAKRPMILAGRGVLGAFARKEFIDFVELTGIPVITSLMGVDAIPFHHRLRAGYIGAYGNRWANLSIGDCDCMLVIGSRLDIRQTGADVAGFKADKVIYHIDIEEGEINNRLTGCVPVVADLKTFLQTALEVWKNAAFPDYTDWYKQIDALRQQWPDTKENLYVKGINPNTFMHQLSQAATGAGAFLADVGTHQMWAAQSLELGEGQYFLTSGGMGAMGFALPAAIGACFGLNNQPVVAIIGDGSMQLNIQELQTIVRNSLPVKIVVINNRSLGMIRQFQDSYFDSRYQSTVWGYTAPDFEKVAAAYGIEAATVSTEAEVEEGLKNLYSDSGKPFLLQVMIDPHANAYPKIAFGRPITEMEPFAKPIEMEGT